MKSLSISALTVCVLAIACQYASAQYTSCAPYNTFEGGCHATCHGCGHHTCCDYFRAGFHANVAWPNQFIRASRRSICDSYAVMINNGWRRQNLLGDYHFDPHTNELTKAGEVKVNWILTQAPVERRNVYVQRAATQEQTTERLAAVEQFSTTLNPAVLGVEVNDTHIVAEGHKAYSVDNIFVGFQDNQPPPVLPASTNAAGSTGTGGN